MSYTKVSTPMPNIAACLDQALSYAGVDFFLAPTLLAAGVTVALDDGTHAWVACVANDDPATPFVEMLVVAIAGTAEGPRMHFGGPLCRVFSHSVPPALVAEIGLNDIRRQLQLVALGEFISTEESWLQLLPAALNDRSIRVAAMAASEITATQGDVL